MPAPKAGSVRLDVGQLPVARADVVLTSPTLGRPQLLNEILKVDTSERESSGRVQPLVDEENLHSAPTGAAALAGYGPLSSVKAGGLGSGLWDGTELRVASSLVNIAVQNTPVGVLNDVVRRALLTRADAPVQKDKMLRPSWLATRAQALETMGLYEDAFNLWRVANDSLRSTDATVLRGWAQSMILAGQHGAACALARPQVASLASDVASANARFWRSVVVVCQALNGERAALGLSVDALAGDTRGSFDPVVLGVLSAAAGKTRSVVLPADEPVPPLAAAVLAATPALIPAESMAQMPDVIARRLMLTEGLPVTLRTAAAERIILAQGNDADVEKLAGFYTSYVFNVDQLSDPIGSAKGMKDGVMARALLAGVALSEQALPDLRRAAWLEFVAATQAAGVPHAARVVLQSKVLAALPLNGAGGAAVLASAVRTALLSGDAAGAQTLLARAGEISGTLPNLAALKLAAEGVAGEVAPATWTLWLTENLNEQAARIPVIAEAAGLDVPAEIWDGLTPLAGSANGNLLDVRRVDALTQTGELVLEAAGLLGNQPAYKAPVLEVAAAARALKKAGLEHEARVLMVEALLPPTPTSLTLPPQPEVQGLKPVPQKARQIGGGKQPALQPPLQPKLPLMPPNRGKAVMNEVPQLPPPRAQ